MKRKGSISIFLAIIFLSIVLLVCTVAETARVNAVQSKTKAIVYMGADSVIAGYAKQVYEDYGILLVWNKESLEETLKKYIQANIKMADIEVSGSDFLDAELEEVSIQKKELATDNGGDAFVKQVSEYLKYAGMSAAINKVFNNSKEIKEDTSKQDVADDIFDKSYDDLSNFVKKIDESIKDINDDEELSNALNKAEGLLKKVSLKKKGTLKKVYKKCDDIQEIITKKESIINDTIGKIKKYLDKKNTILKEKGYKQSAKDYLEENLKVLKQIKSKIKEINKFDSAVSLKGTPNEKTKAVNFINTSNQIYEWMKDLKVSKVSEKDKKNKSIFDSAKSFLNKGVLSLVVKDASKLSTSTVNTSSLPSQTSQSDSKENSQIKDKALMGVYSYLFFGNYISPKKNNSLKYGMEYLVVGNDNDKDNLASVVERLVLIRHVPNYTCLLKDAKKKGEIETVAMSIATLTGLPFLEPLAKALLTEAWVMAESVADVKSLLKGEKLSLIKTDNNWKTSLQNLFHASDKGESSGFKYEVYLELLITLCGRNNIVYRTMDLIQMNICNKYNKEFRMNKGIMSFKSTVSFDVGALFSSMPWSIKTLSETNESYKFNIQCSNGY